MPPDTNQGQVGELERLAPARFSDLTAAEIKLLRAAPNGDLAVCGPSKENHDPANDPAKADEWGKEREIRADLIRWLCVDRQAREMVDPKGILVAGAKILGTLDLSYARVPFGLNLWRCRLTGKTNLQATEIAELDFQGSWLDSIDADSVKAKGNVLFCRGFHATGQVRLLGAEIGGGLDCTGATFENPLQSEVPGALIADRAVVKGSVFLKDGFTAKGEVRLLNAEIGSNLDCSGGKFESPPQTGVAARGDAFSADGALVKGNIFLKQDFSAKGAVRLPAAQIWGDLTCSGGTFAGTLMLERASIKGTLWLDVADAAHVSLDLINASVDALVDNTKSWPAPGNLALDGFVYRRFSAGAPNDAASRLDWLARQAPFVPQPYRQLAKVLRDEGDDSGARRVLYKMECRRNSDEGHVWKPQATHGCIRQSISYVSHHLKAPAVSVWNAALRLTIGYGYYPGRALALLLLFVALGWPLFRCGYFYWNIVPSEKEAYSDFKKDHRPPAHYERFCAFVYSLENSFPLVKLGQVDRWQPDPSPPEPHDPAKDSIHRMGRAFVSAGFLRIFRWFQILLGWVLATLFAAGVTGVVRKN